jgi:hypothetical protein
MAKTTTPRLRILRISWLSQARLSTIIHSGIQALLLKTLDRGNKISVKETLEAVEKTLMVIKRTSTTKSISTYKKRLKSHKKKGRKDMKGSTRKVKSPSILHSQISRKTAIK